MSFRFKQFAVEDSRCAMKVGTDGVLLGCWAPAGTRILDAGTGSGLVALMMAQRCPEARTDAIDIDAAAVEQAQENFAASPWQNRLRAVNSRLQEWDPPYRYDLIVSNPPYFQDSLKNPDNGRRTARHTDTLSYAELMHHAARLLTDDGQLALILPAAAETQIREIATEENLLPTRTTRVFSKEGKPPRRVLLSFVMTKSRNHEITKSRDHDSTAATLVLEDEKGGRSLPYQELCRDFYL